MVEMEKSPKEIGKKYWKMLKIMLYMMRKGVCKSKLVLDFHMLLSQGKLATKAINKLILHNHHSYFAALTCRSSDDARMSFISPREYEFSCSNTPVYSTTSYGVSKRKNHRDQHHHLRPAQEANVVQKVFEILNNHEDDDDDDDDGTPEESPAPRGAVRGTCMGAQMKDADKNNQVDKDAEAFIKKFYKDLKNQKRIAALESPSPYHKWAR